MKKVLLILIILFSLLFINFNHAHANSVESEFLIEVHNNYDDYKIITNEENVYGHIIIVLGTTNNKNDLSLSIYYKLKESIDYPLQISVINNKNKEKLYTFNKNTMLKTYYKIPIDYSKEYKLSIVDMDSFYILKSFQIGKYENTDAFYQLNDIIKGNGNNKFLNTDELKSNVKSKDEIAKFKTFVGILVIYLYFSTLGLIFFAILTIKEYKHRHRKYIYSLDEILQFSKEKLYGKTICFATDTVFGIGALLDDNYGQRKIYKLKNRSEKKPLAVLAGSMEMVLKYVKEPSDEVKELMEKHWPGALTIIFDKKVGIGTLAFRVPDNKYTLELLNHFGPLATTSVNISGEAPLNSIEDINKVFGYRIDYIVKFPEDLPSSNLSSTVIKVEDEEILILRQGTIEIKNDL